jgi:hypothetical protein
MMVPVVRGILSSLRHGAIVHHLLHLAERDGVGGIVGVFGDDGAGTFVFHHLLVFDFELALTYFSYGGDNTRILVNPLGTTACGQCESQGYGIAKVRT